MINVYNLTNNILNLLEAVTSLASPRVTQGRQDSEHFKTYFKNCK